MDDDISEEEAKALLEEGGPDAAGAEPAEPEERPEDFIIEGKRRRTPVDYRILNFVSGLGASEITVSADSFCKGYRSVLTGEIADKDLRISNKVQSVDIAVEFMDPATSTS